MIDLFKPIPPNGYPAPTREQEERASSPAAPALELWSPEAIWKPLEPPDYLADGLLIRGSLALIVAYGSSLKTWVLEDAALSFATGTRWLDRFDCKKARALIIDFESGDYELRRRAHRLAIGRDLATPIDGFTFCTMPAVNLADDAFFDAVRRLASDFEFIGIDSLAAGSGGIDENDARFATSLNRLKAIAAKSGCVVVLLHHTRKGGGEESDEREMVRGTSAIFNACDVVLNMTRAKDDSFVVRQSKARGGKKVEPFVVSVVDTLEGGSVVRGRDVEEQEAENVSATLKRAKSAIVVAIGEGRLPSKNAVYRRCKGKRATLVAALTELVETKVVSLGEDGSVHLSSGGS